MDKAAKLEQVDVDAAGVAGRGVISDLRDALGVAYEAMESQEQAETGEAGV